MDHFSKVHSLLTEAEYMIVSADPEAAVLILNDEESGLVQTVLLVADPLLVIEQVLFQADMSASSLAGELLRMNRDLVSGAFCMDDDDRIIFRDTLRLANIDLAEIESSLNALELLLSEFGEQMIEFSKTEAQ